MSDTKPFIIGISGYAGAGKDKFAAMLREQLEQRSHTVALVSSGDLIRQYVLDHQLGDIGDRALLQRVVSEVAKTHGYTYWLEQSIKQAAAAGTEVLLCPGLRQEVEVDALHDRGDVIIAIDVPIEQRYERSQQRSRPGDDISFEQFKKNEEAERAGAAQQIDAVIAKADTIIDNDGTLEQLEAVAADIAAGYPAKPKPAYKATSYKETGV